MVQPPDRRGFVNITPDVETGIGAWSDDEIKRAIGWLEEMGVKVEPVEINTIEG